MLDYHAMPELLAIYVEGETKTGKGAASEAIANTLHDEGVSVYHAVAGDFFRRFTAIIRRDLALDEAAPLPERDELTSIATKLFENREAFSIDPALGDLQRPEISNCVSQLGELAIAQEAAVVWYEETVRQAIDGGYQVLVMDGRNPRRHVEELDAEVRTILDIYMTCDPEIAARRTWAAKSVTDPSHEQISAEAAVVADRRQRDRERAEWPFHWPTEYFTLTDDATGFVERSRQTGDNPPLPIVIDNSALDLPTMTALVAQLTRDAL